MGAKEHLLCIKERDNLSDQIAELANFIIEEIPGEPSKSEGAIDCAIRLLKKANDKGIFDTGVGDKLFIYRNKLKVAREYYAANKKELENQISVEESAVILAELPDILKSDHMVWCKNGNLEGSGQYAEPCADTECMYKQNKTDIVSGCASCKRFQITKKAKNRESAVITHEPGSTRIDRGH